jgi:uncharacterized protein DUF6256
VNVSATVPLRVVAPVVSAFGLFLAVALVSLRRGGSPTHRSPSVRSPASWRGLLTTALGGYALFLVIVLVFHVVIAHQRDAMRYAVAGGAVLAFGVAVPSFAILDRLEAALRRRRSR